MPDREWGAPARLRRQQLALGLAILLLFVTGWAGEKYGDLGPGLSRLHQSLYRIALAWGRWPQLWLVPGPARREGNFLFWGTTGDTLARRWLDAAEQAYARVSADLGWRIPAPIPIVAHSGGGEMEKYAPRGLAPAASPTSALYWRGVIRVNAAVAADPAGPLAHELTHYALDQVAGNRVPRWFSEGLAQWEEFRLTGYWLFDPSAAPRLPWGQLERQFLSLPEEVAYGSAFSAVLFLCGEGEEALREAVQALAAGYDFETAVRMGWGREPGQLMQAWLAARK